MFKFIAVFALAAVASAAPGFVSESHHSFVQPAVLTKTAFVDNSASSAITHQSFTKLEKKVPVVHSYAAAPVVKTVSYESAPVVKSVSYSAPVVKTVAPVVHTYESAPVVKSVSYSAPVVKTIAAAPVVHTYESAPVVKSVSYATAPVVKTVAVHSAPLVKTVVSAPVAYSSYHH
ncbi:cuticle protein LPCP-23-like [Lucilia cuprina]|uniref:cuticle protein LPCP-23-like n=1 Tax=Lucilia cuprina TaxID=7375 RepID=UPI001F06440F|nr:cuticle protein LPCP-23-like [Lucilia cuprina]